MARAEDKPTVVMDMHPFAQLPCTFGQYRLLRLIARSMALVYEAEDSRSGRKVALKMPSEHHVLTEEARRRFLREVKLTSHLAHAGIVPVYDSGEHNGIPYYTMPFIQGERLDTYLDSQSTSLMDKVQLFAKLARVVAALHQEGLVHRDLKPANILVDQYGEVRLLDFGLAKSTRVPTDVTLARTFLGTLDYMAPEQASATSEVGPAADVYALGIMMYRGFTGEPPYLTGDDARIALRQIAEAKPRRMSEFARDVPLELERLVLDCLHKKPEQRPADASVLVERMGSLPEAETTSRLRLVAGMGLVVLGGALLAAGIYHALPYWR
ncbi:MAG: serine/threonine-protein kinase [Verrucomicrobiota bacterium]